MKKLFFASLCYHGLIGGTLILEDDALVYRTNSLTVEQKHRHLSMPFAQMTAVVPGAFSTLAITMNDGETWRFLVFGRKRLMEKLNNR